MNCQQACEKLLFFLDNELEDKEKRAVALHLEICPGCRQKLQDLRNTQGLLRRDFQALTRNTVPAWIWMELQQQLEASSDRGPSVLNRIKTRLQAFIGRRPRRKLVMLGALLIALIAGSSILIPWLMSPPQKVLASEIVINAPEVRALSGGTPQVEAAEVSGATGYILSQGASGESNLAYVDLQQQSVARLFRLTTPPLTENDKAESLDIARADPQIQQILAAGGAINTNDIFALSPRLKLDIINGQPVVWSEGTLVGVTLRSKDLTWIARIDLRKGIVAGVSRVSQASPIQLVKKGDDSYSREVSNIAESDKRVSTLLNEGAEVDHIAIGGGDMVHRGAMILKLGDEVWTVRVNLSDRTVTGVYLVPEAKYSQTNLFSPE